MRSRRITVSRTPNPQSMSTHVPPASTTRPFPSLPLPSDAKRMCAARLLQLVFEQRENLLAVGALVGGAVRVLHGHEAVRVGLGHGDPVLLGLVDVVLPEHQLVEEALF